MKPWQIVFLTTALVPLAATASQADSLTLSGSDLLDGSFTTSQIAAEATASNTVTANGYTGISLWSFLGGSDTTTSTTTAAGTTKNYGSITTFNPTGANPNPNYDLRSYVVATGSSGATSVVSLGQIDPGFVGNSSATPFVAFQTSGGTALSAPVLVVPGGPSGSTVTNLTSLSLQSVPALSGAGGVSTGVTVSGNVTSPQTYTSFPGTSATTTVPVLNASNAVTDTYTGIPLATLLNVPSTANASSQIVVATGTDGYQVVYSLDELLNADGTANANDILAYAATGTDFPADGLARTVTAGDGPYKHGRFVSNLDSLEVLDATTPLPASLPFFAAGIFMIGLLRKVTRREPAFLS